MGNLDALEAWPDLASFQSDFVAESGMGELRLTAPRISDNRIDQDLGGQSDLACLPGGSLAKQFQRFAANRLDSFHHVPGRQLREQLDHVKQVALA